MVIKQINMVMKEILIKDEFVINRVAFNEKLIRNSVGTPEVLQLAIFCEVTEMIMEL